MKHLPHWFYTALAISAATAVLGAIPHQAWGVMALAVATAAGWAIAHTYGQPYATPAATLGLMGFYATLAYGVGQGMAGGWVLVGGTAALAAWDLARLSHRVSAQPIVQHEAQLWAGHWRPLTAVLLLSLALGTFALLATITLTFWLALGLALAALLLVNYLVQNLEDGGK